MIEQLSAFNGVKTLRLDHDVKVRGKSTTNQIDVLWEFQDVDGHVMRIAIEARHLARRVDQGRLHAFRSVVDDIATDDVTTRGVMITTTGYQSGAKEIAKTYGIAVLELRAPVDSDWAGRIRATSINLHVQVPWVTNLVVGVDPTWTGNTTISGRTDEMYIGDQTLQDFMYGELLVGHAARIGEAAEMRRMQFPFDPPRLLRVAGQPDVPIVAIAADYQETSVLASSISTEASASIAWVLLDSIGESRAWVRRDGSITITPAGS